MNKAKIIAAALITAISSTGFAAPHGFEVQIGSSELDPSISEDPNMVFPKATPSSTVSSLAGLYETFRVDGAGYNAHKGSIVPSKCEPRISLYEVERGSSEASGNEAYYARFPAWDDISDITVASSNCPTADFGV